MSLHPDAQAVLDKLASMKLAPLDALSPAEAREQFKQSREVFLAPTEAVAQVRDQSLPGPHGPIGVRVYRPDGHAPAQALPALVYFHGGGWVFGDLDTHDPLCRQLANRAGCVVVAVDYRLAPENKFPFALDDALTATRYVASHAEAFGVDGERLAVAGDSAGGNLSAAVALSFRDQGGPKLALQVLIYPVIDMAMATPSHTKFAEGYMLSRERMRYFRAAYLRDDRDIADWRASPLKASDLSGLPPALVITAGHDPLVDEGKAYADRLAASGVVTTYTCYPGLIHGFLTMAGTVRDANRAIEQIAAALLQAMR